MKYTQPLKTIDSTSQHPVGRAAAAVNQALVIRNCLIGASIVVSEDGEVVDTKNQYRTGIKPLIWW